MLHIIEHHVNLEPFGQDCGRPSSLLYRQERLTKVARQLCVVEDDAIRGGCADSAALRGGHIVDDLGVCGLNVCWHRASAHILVHLQQPSKFQGYYSGHMLVQDFTFLSTCSNPSGFKGLTLLQLSIASIDWQM